MVAGVKDLLSHVAGRDVGDLLSEIRRDSEATYRLTAALRHLDRFGSFFCIAKRRTSIHTDCLKRCGDCSDM